MTFENRQPANYAFGSLTNAAAISDTSLVSNDFQTRLASGLSTTTYVPMTLQDPSTGVYEVVWVTAHTAASATATVVRAKEGSTARAWGAGTLWTIAPTLRDGVLPVANRAALPADPHVGLRAYLLDEQIVVQYVLNVGWLSHSGMAYRASQILGADAAQVSFTGIPSILKGLQVVWSGRGTTAAVSVLLQMRVNADTNPAYYGNYHTQQQVTITSAVETAATAGTVGILAGASASAQNWGSGVIFVPGWNQPGTRLAVNYQWHSNVFDTAANSFLAQGGGMYTNTGPYTSLQLLPASGNLKANSEFSLYGWG